MDTDQVLIDKITQKIFEMNKMLYFELFYFMRTQDPNSEVQFHEYVEEVFAILGYCEVKNIPSISERYVKNVKINLHENSFQKYHKLYEKVLRFCIPIKIDCLSLNYRWMGDKLPLSNNMYRSILKSSYKVYEDFCIQGFKMSYKQLTGFLHSYAHSDTILVHNCVLEGDYEQFKIRKGLRVKWTKFYCMGYQCSPHVDSIVKEIKKQWEFENQWEFTY